MRNAFMLNRLIKCWKIIISTRKTTFRAASPRYGVLAQRRPARFTVRSLLHE